jgi:DNA-binding transcriptional regulator YiaG
MRTEDAQETIRQLKNLGLSSADIASKVGASDASVRAWGSGARQPYYTTHEKLLRILYGLKKRK